MTAPHQSPAFGSLAFIAVVIAAGAAAFAYTAGWFSPQRLTPGKLVAAFVPPTGVFRRRMAPSLDRSRALA
jgi:catalase